MHPLYDTKTWVFDLDNTLYAPHSNLFDQIDTRIRQHVQGISCQSPLSCCPMPMKRRAITAEL